MRGFIEDLSATLDAIDSATPSYNPILFYALTAAEDRRFLFHFGVDPISICRAATHYVLWRRLEGASTIEAQLVRTISGRREISLRRKLREALMASIISLSRSKHSIAMAYLEAAYFGFEERGIKFAASALSVNLIDISASEACDLVARLKRPSSGPASSPHNGMLRRRIAWLLPKVSAQFAYREVNIPT